MWGQDAFKVLFFFFFGSENTRHNLRSLVVCGRECSCQRPVSSWSVCHTVLQQLHHQVSLNWPPQNVLLADKGWAFEAGNPNHLKLTDESFSYKPPESFIILVTMLHCNVLPHATMLYSYARCGNTVYSDRMFSLYHTPCQPQIVKIVFDLK